VAYKSLLTERRQILHELTGRTIERMFGERLEDHLTELAHHFDRGGNTPKAVEYLSRTGSKPRSKERIRRRSATSLERSNCCHDCLKVLPATVRN